MARRIGITAQWTGCAIGIDRLRWLLRNPDFQRELAATQHGWSQETGLDGYFGLLRKWGLSSLPLKLVSEPFIDSVWTLDTIRRCEQILAETVADSLTSPRTEDLFFIQPPVTAWDYCNEYAMAHWDGEGDFAVPPTVPRMVDLTVDLRYPKDVIDEYIRLERVKPWRSGRTFQVSSLSAPAKGRNRLDTSDVQLTVFDLRTAGLSLDQIAVRLGRPKTSIQAAYEAAKRNIGDSVAGFRGSSEGIAVKRIEEAGGFNLEKHMAECKKCQQARKMAADALSGVESARSKSQTSEKEYCPLVAAYLDYDYVPRAEALLATEPDADPEDEPWLQTRAYVEDQPDYALLQSEEGSVSEPASDDVPLRPRAKARRTSLIKRPPSIPFAA